MCKVCSMSNEQMEPTDNKLIGPNDDRQVGSSELNAVSPEQRTIGQDSSNPHEASSSLPTVSLTSIDNCGSNCCDLSVDVNPLDRHDPEQGQPESCQDDPYKQQSKSIPVNEPENLVDNKVKDKEDDNNPSKDESADEENDTSLTFDVEDEIWNPPEPDNEEDDQESVKEMANLDDSDDEEDNQESTMVVANLDEDKDECANIGIGLKKSISLSGSEVRVSRSQHFEEEKKKAMVEVKNGKFKNLVSQLIDKLGVDNCNSKNESWVDIVTQLAWEAASNVKPDTADDKAMDPAGCVKVKCIATGSRMESQLIKGLVFKKHAAHKSMTTNYKKPRLLLIQGMLQSSASSGWASLHTMVKQANEGKQEKDQDENEDADLFNNLKACHPNVILVEKSASRRLLTDLLASGITVVLDMKLHRLERVSRCIGLPILSSDAKFDQKLKRCKSLKFEKFVEEHADVGEGEKKPCKTFMFVEGGLTCHGSTILLKGSNSEELKKIKCVVQCAVVMAYHFILETSFLVHQKAMFSTIAFGGAVVDIPLTDKQSTSVVSETSANGVHVPISNDNNDARVQESTVEILIPNAFHEEKSTAVEETPAKAADINTLNYHDKDTNTTFSDKIKELYILSPDTYQQYMEFNGGKDGAPTGACVSPTEMAINVDVVETKGSPQEDKLLGNDSQILSISSVADGDARKADDDIEDYLQPKDDISSVLDSESILVLTSSRNASRGTICEQSHLSHIKFYRNFDVPLGKFLRDNLFNQTDNDAHVKSVHCKACGEQPEAHYYYYAHHNKQLTIRVKQLVDRKLPGEAGGKLWMWSRCGKCEPDKGKTTERVLISTDASGLSFGKFLELSFSSQSAFNKLSNCGHSLQKDFLYFFGLGSMVSMFRYSCVATYTVSVPPQKLEFNNPFIGGDWLQKEIESVHTKGLLLFATISDYLKKLASQFSGSKLVLNGSLKTFTDIMDMLNLERSEFEENIKKFGFKDENSENSHLFLRMNYLRWEILLEACVWDRRLHLLLSSSSNSPNFTASTNGDVEKRIELKGDSGVREAKEGSQTAEEKGELVQIVLKERTSEGEVQGTQNAAEEGKMDLEETHSEGTMVIGSKIVEGERSLNKNITPCVKGMPRVAQDGHQNAVIEGRESSENCDLVDFQIESVKELLSEGMLQGGEIQDLISVPITEGMDQGPTGDSIPSISSPHESESTSLSSNLGSNGESSQRDKISKSGDQMEDGEIPSIKRQDVPEIGLLHLEDLMWNSFEKIREECMKDLQEGFRPKFELLLAPGISSTFAQVIMEEGLRLHIPFSNGNYIVSDYDGEISSFIACALACRKNLNPDENGSIQRATSVPSFGALKDSDDRHTIKSVPSLPPTASLVSHGPMHLAVSLGSEKYPPKGKYSVVILYAEKFFDLRKDCCLSELDYIASLNRCKTWDAKGGKSKSVFAKTLDDRLIIKEIKKTEYESFMEFAPNYFDYMKQSFKLGNQTCLAKILGIYQVTIRHPKSGKETKHDIMVQENLSYGRNTTRQYDLKGALHARFTETADDVLLDQNFVNDMNSSPLYVGQKAKRLLQRAVWNDTTFLTSINVMDYSLLVGVDRQRRELVCGIIDYLRQYTWDKQLETWVKTSLVTPKNMLPTIISPKEYKKRFRKFMDTHFLTVPDKWCSHRSSNPCKLCGIRSGDSSPVRLEKEKQEGDLNGFH